MLRGLMDGFGGKAGYLRLLVRVTEGGAVFFVRREFACKLPEVEHGPGNFRLKRHSDNATNSKHRACSHATFLRLALQLSQLPVGFSVFYELLICISLLLHIAIESFRLFGKCAEPCWCMGSLAACCA